MDGRGSTNDLSSFPWSFPWRLIVLNLILGDNYTYKFGWWFQTCFISAPIWRNDSFWWAYSSNGWFNDQLDKYFNKHPSTPQSSIFRFFWSKHQIFFRFLFLTKGWTQTGTAPYFSRPFREAPSLHLQLLGANIESPWFELSPISYHFIWEAALFRLTWRIIPVAK